ncbi:hypothetical protein CLDAP_21090 [Caldilinea aerophila DSM 14535 = NBRC 104270]|uniref:Uncharacterized protein n=1 Tax=Caldilinea aerophila (strain DSM 14535 / JCM 11387 / NBRC 104270 / STL-6-O1) TaxID=926550 RepID=I0I4G1_CALAS|nr:hypothetical protein CLDAP_21090 [Caldilinea aerophila DSM 14535 = NBRC 104270]
MNPAAQQLTAADGSLARFFCLVAAAELGAVGRHHDPPCRASWRYGLQVAELGAVGRHHDPQDTW